MTASTAAPVWMITGCSSGFGREIAVCALGRGYRVVVTARDLKTIAPLEAEHPETVLALALDVTDKLACTTSVAAAENRFGRIDVLVNNAGYGYYAAIEEGEEAVVRTLFDTHLFGLVTLTKLVLPGMRERRHGRIVNVSSIGGLMGFAGAGYYCAAKFAVEGLSEALAKEVEPLGVRVTVVEPGPFQTNFIAGSHRASSSEIADYASTAGTLRHAAPNRQLPGDPVRAARAIVDAVDAADPPLRLLLGRSAYDRVTEKLATVIEDFEAWKDLSLSADFPPDEARGWR